MNINNELHLSYKIDKEYKVSTNKIYAWCHWRTRQKISDYYHELVRDDCLSLKQFEYKVDIKMVFIFKWRTLDSSNCGYMGKCLEDWFKTHWLIKDDSIEFVWDFTTRSEKGKEDKVDIYFIKSLQN
jgi:hypothetical protein